MITHKFPYIELKREATAEGRKYITSVGTKLPSVTTILSATESIEKKEALSNWRKRIGHTKAAAITAESSGRGTRMHKFLEDYIKTGQIGEPGSNPYSIQSHRMANNIIAQGLSKCNEFWGTEVSLYFPEVYAGTTDLVGVHDNAEAILDHKQTNKPKRREWIEDYFVQLAAYATAHNEVHNTKIRKGVIFMCSKDFLYQEFIIEGTEFDTYQDKWFKRLEAYYTKFL